MSPIKRQKVTIPPPVLCDPPCYHARRHAAMAAHNQKLRLELMKALKRNKDLRLKLQTRKAALPPEPTERERERERERESDVEDVVSQISRQRYG